MSKPSEMFEGKNSSLRKTCEEAVNSNYRFGKNIFTQEKIIKNAQNGKVIMYTHPTGNLAIISWNKYLDIIKQERLRIKEEVEKMTTKCPERESDEYDKGQEDFKNRVLKLLV